MSDTSYFKGKALIIGINSYEYANKLSKAANDARTMADALKKLSFYTDLLVDANIDDCDKTLESFISSLGEFDVGVFYFAGHGIEVEGKNYLLAQNTPIESKSAVIRYSISLQDVVHKMHNTGCPTNIVIIDACRNDPYPDDRGYGTTNLAPMFAPKGTIIAYSTSPGEKAKDSGIGDNSIYTGALLQHINVPGLPIEEFFKRVRTTVYSLSNQKQTSWEHTSLIGNFSFNSGQLIHSLGLPYSLNVIVDKDFDCSDPIIGEIISDFKSSNYYTQNTALKMFSNTSLEKMNKNQLFIIGRNILQAAVGGCWKCTDFISNQNLLEKYTTSNENHLFNGILFEIYFNSEGHLRSQSFKGDLLDQLMPLRNIESLTSSFEFISNVLFPFSSRLLFIPSIKANTVAINVILKKDSMKNPWNEDREVFYFVDSVIYNTTDLLKTSEDDVKCTMSHSFSNLKELNKYICKFYTIPESFLTIASNVPNPEYEIILNKPLAFL